MVGDKEDGLAHQNILDDLPEQMISNIRVHRGQGVIQQVHLPLTVKLAINLVF